MSFLCSCVMTGDPKKKKKKLSENLKNHKEDKWNIIKGYRKS